MTLAFAPRPHAPVALASEGRAGDRYLAVLAACLLGYALLGRPFAYLGVPPLFVGEVLLAAGLALTVRLRGLHRLGGVGPFWVLLALQVLTLVRSVPYVSLYGLDVARDAMLFGYGFFAYVVYLMLVERPERLRDLVRRYRTFAVVMVALVWLPYLAFRVNEAWIPFMPGQDNVRVVEAKGGDLLVHLSGIAALLLLGLRRPSWTVTLGLALTAVLVMVSNRGGTIAFVLACGLAVALRPPSARGARLGFALVAVVVAGVAAVPVMQSVRISDNSRALTVEQIWDNVRSIVGQSDSHTLETTKAWRLAWWGKIVDDTVFGDRFWTGRGFGLNFADYDGFAVDDEGSLRSPHNATMTVLGRLGVPGLALWLLLHAWWSVAMLRAWWHARAARRDAWAAVFAFGLCLWVALVVNASFEVYFEGPMGGIWLWTVVGAGLAAVRVFRVRPDLFSTSDFTDAPPAAPPAAPPRVPDVPARTSAEPSATPWADPAAAPRARPLPALPAIAPRRAPSWADAPTPWDRPEMGPAAPPVMPRTALRSTEETPGGTEGTPRATEGTVWQTQGTLRGTERTVCQTEQTSGHTEGALRHTEGTPGRAEGTPGRAEAARRPVSPRPSGLTPAAAAWASTPRRLAAPRPTGSRPSDARWDWSPTGAAWRSS